MALAQIGGATTEEIKAAMPQFRGVDRRFDFKIKNSHIVFLSDYAHHPEEIRQSVSSIRKLYPNRKSRPYSSLIFTHVPAISIRILPIACHS